MALEVTEIKVKDKITIGTQELTSAVTSVGGTGTVAGLTLSGTVTTTGNLTLGGTLSTPVSTINDSTTVGQNLVKLANPSAIRFIRINETNTVDALSNTDFRTAIGANTDLGITAGTTDGPIVTSSTGNNATLPLASTTASGVLSNAAQTIGGEKTFANGVVTGSGSETWRIQTGATTFSIQSVASGVATTRLSVNTSGLLTSVTNTNWDAAYTHSQVTTGAVHGATTVGNSFFRLTNPSAIRFPRINANNTVTALSDADFITAIGAANVITKYRATQQGAGSTAVATVTSITLLANQYYHLDVTGMWSKSSTSANTAPVISIAVDNEVGTPTINGRFEWLNTSSATAYTVSNTNGSILTNTTARGFTAATATSAAITTTPWGLKAFFYAGTSDKILTFYVRQSSSASGVVNVDNIAIKATRVVA
jgi:hypothetical protein